ncbi:SRPBCC family protein [Cumulibacter soli]|uniref:SRPBCC family protein n=1 Tax=Cumulibacter soli TaxID=2546344 RepID=UPI00106817EA|nr:SRPBCC family protein [Cumulibacter soli]
MSIEQHVRTRTIAAAPEAIFAVLSDPAQHSRTEPTDWVRGALESNPDKLTRVGQMFGMEMFHVNAGRYEIDNKVIALEPNRTIAWQPGQTENGTWGSGGWWWRYDLEPVDGGTAVTLTYDWTDVPEAVRAEFGGFPAVPVEFIDESLKTLDAYVTG